MSNTMHLHAALVLLQCHLKCTKCRSKVQNETHQRCSVDCLHEEGWWVHTAVFKIGEWPRCALANGVLGIGVIFWWVGGGDWHERQDNTKLMLVMTTHSTGRNR